MLYPSIIDKARFVTDQIGSNQGGTDVQLIALLGPMYTECVRRVAKAVPSFYTYQINVTELESTPENPVGKYTQVRKVERRVSEAPRERWLPVPPADENLTGYVDRICWRSIGQQVEILPPETTGTFRIEYVPNLAMPGADTHLDIPEGLDWYLAHLLAIPIRIKLDQSTKVHEDEAEKWWDKTIAGMLPQASQPRTPSDYDADEDCW